MLKKIENKEPSEPKIEKPESAPKTETDQKKKDKEDKPKSLETTFHRLSDGRIAEEIYRDKKEQFVIFNPKDKKYIYRTRFKDNGKTYVPRKLRKDEDQSLTLADGVEKYSSLAELRQDIRNWALKGFDPVDNSDLFQLTLDMDLVSWVLDWQFPLPEKYVPMMAIIGSSETGKKRWLTVHRLLSYRGLYFLKTNKVPTLFRALEPWRGTLIMDEADSDEELHGEYSQFLNSRCDSVIIPRFNPKTGQVEYYYSFGFTILALRNPLVDDGSMSRVVKFPSGKTQRPKDYGLLPTKEWGDDAIRLRRKLLYFRLTHLDSVVMPTQLDIPKAYLFRVKTAVLMIKALEKEDPTIMDNVPTAILTMQRNITEERAASPEGLVINELYEIVQDDDTEFEKYGDGHRIFKRRVDEIIVGEKQEQREHITQITTSYIVEQLNNKSMSATVVGRILRGLEMTTTQRREGKQLIRGTVIIRSMKRLKSDIEKYVVDADDVSDRLPKEGK